MFELNTTFKNLWDQVRHLWQGSAHWRKYLGYMFHLAAIAFMGIAFTQSLRLINVYNIQVDYKRLIVVFLCVFIVVLMGALNWWLLTVALEFDGAGVKHIRAHLVSNISKYLPGTIWGYLSKGTLSAQAGASKQKVIIAIILEMFLALTSGIILIFYTGSIVGNVLALPFHLPKAIWVGLAIITALVSCWAAANIILRNVPGDSHKLHATQKIFLVVVSVISIYALGWGLLALSLSWFVDAVNLGQSGSLSLYLFVLCVSMVLGILAIIVPNGVGVREGMLVILLSNTVSLPVALMASFGLRIAIIVGEFVAFLLIVTPFHRIIPK